MDCIVHGVANSPTQLSDFHFQQSVDFEHSLSMFIYLYKVVTFGGGGAVDNDSIACGPRTPRVSSHLSDHMPGPRMDL